ncbi:alpha/beta fold hydrolase [Streptomyces atratus]|uniref:alpha/beta fold hydrolase n=1 Tax=Streptomyces atratus TaxID=1893 RepID=UPI0038CFC9A8
MRVGGGREPRLAARAPPARASPTRSSARPSPWRALTRPPPTSRCRSSTSPTLVAADVDPEFAAVLAVSRHPLSARAFTETAPVAAWKTKPSWALIATSGRTLNPDMERYGYERASMTTTEVDSSHMVMLTQPKRLAELIQDAVRSTAHWPAPRAASVRSRPRQGGIGTLARARPCGAARRSVASVHTWRVLDCQSLGDIPYAVRKARLKCDGFTKPQR